MLIRPKPFPPKKRSFTFRPDIISKSIVDVDFDYLKKLGVVACFIDLDGTVVSRATFVVDPRIKKALAKSGLKIYIATNRPKTRSLQNLQKDLSATGVIHPHKIFGKPSKRYYTNALKELELKPHQAVMIGDRYIQDILGANRSGIYSLLVHKLGASMGRADRFISKVESLLTKFFSRKFKKLK